MTDAQIDGLRIAAPCPASWQGMAGDDRVRHCTLCSLNVYNFAEMTREEVRELLVRTEGRVCARLYRRADGTVITRDCPTGLRALRRRASRAGAALITADVNGAFRTASLGDGLYRVDVALEGLTPASIEHLPLKAGEVTHARVAVQFEATSIGIVVGAVAPVSIESGSTTFTQDFINKLPL
jgi:hypothetical protein